MNFTLLYGSLGTRRISFSYDLKATLRMPAQTPNVKPNNSSNRARPVRNVKSPFGSFCGFGQKELATKRSVAKCHK